MADAWSRVKLLFRAACGSARPLFGRVVRSIFHDKDHQGVFQDIARALIQL
jgi:hypothetical protein